MRGVTIATSLALCLSLTTAEADPDPRGRHAARPRAFDFAADVNEVVGEITEEFNCDGLDYGYYADQFQDCKVFHICMPVKSDTGKVLDTFQFSFFCPNQTLFSQDTRTCISNVYAYPCHDAHKLYELNKAFGHQPKNRKKPLNTSFRKSVGIVANAKNSENIADLFKSRRRKEHTKLKIDKPPTPFIPQLTSPFTLHPNTRTTPNPITESSFVSTSHQHNLKNEAVSAGGISSSTQSGSSRRTDTNRAQAIHKNPEIGSFNNVVVKAEPIIPGGAHIISQTSTNLKKAQSHASKVTPIKKVPSATSSILGSSSLSTQTSNASGNQGSLSPPFVSNQSSSRGKINKISSSINRSRGSAVSFGNNHNHVNSKNVVNNISTGSNAFGTASGSNTSGHRSSISNFDSSKHTDTRTAGKVSSRGSSNIGAQKVSVVLAGNQVSPVSSTAGSSDLTNTHGSSTASFNGLNTARVSSVSGNQAGVRASSNINNSRGSNSLNKGGATLHNADSSITSLSNSQHFKKSGLGLSSGNQLSPVSSTAGTPDFTNIHGSSTASFNGLNTARGSSVSVNRGSVRGSSTIDTSKIPSAFNKASHNTATGSTASVDNKSIKGSSNLDVSMIQQLLSNAANTFIKDNFNTASGSSVAGNEATVRGSLNINTSRGSSRLNKGGATLHNTGFSSTTSSNSQNFKNSGIGLSSASFSTTGRSNSVIFGSNDEHSTSTESSFVSQKVQTNSPLSSPINIPGSQLVSVSRRPTHTHTVSFDQHNAGNNIKSTVNSQSQSEDAFNTNSQFKTITDASVIVGKPAVPSVGRGITTILGRKSEANTHNTFSSQSRGSSSGSVGSQNLHDPGSGNRNANSFESGKFVKNNIGIHQNTDKNHINIPGFSSGVHRVNGHLESDAITSNGHSSTFGTTLPLPITTKAPFVSRPIHSTNVPRTSTFITNTENSVTQTTNNQHSQSSLINSSNNVKQGSFSSTKKSTGINFPGRSPSTQTSSLNTNTGSLRGSRVIVNTGNQNDNSHGQVSLDSNNRISTGVKLTGNSSGASSSGASLASALTSHVNENLSSSVKGSSNLDASTIKQLLSNAANAFIKNNFKSPSGSTVASNQAAVRGSLTINTSRGSSNLNKGGATLHNTGISEQNQSLLNSGRRGTTVSQINVSGTQSKRRGSNRSRVSSSTTTGSRLRGSGVTVNTGNQNDNSHGQVSLNSNNRISTGVQLSGISSGASLSGASLTSVPKSHVNENHSSSNILSGSGLSEQNQSILNSGRRRTAVSQINVSGTQSQRRGSTHSQVSSSTTPSSRTTSRGSRRFKIPTGIKFPGKSGSQSTSHTNIPTHSNANSLRVKTRGGSNSQAGQSNSHTTVSNGFSSFSKNGASVNSKLNANLPQTPSIPGATLVAVSRRPVIKQSGISSQSEGEVVHDRGTFHKVSHNVQNLRGSTSTTGRITSQLTGTTSQHASKHKTSFNSNKQNSSNSRSTSKLPRTPSIAGATLIAVTRRPVQSKSSTKQAGFKLKTESKTQEVNTAPKILSTIQEQRGSTVLGGTSKSNVLNIPSSANIPGAKLVSIRKRPVNITNGSQSSNINVHNSFRTVNAGSIIGKPAVSLHGANIASSNVQQNNEFTVELGKKIDSQHHSHILQEQNSNAQVNKHPQTLSVSNNDHTTNDLLSSVVTNSITQGSRVGITGSSQVKETSSQDSSVSFGTNRQIQKGHESSTTNRAQTFIDNSSQNINSRKTPNAGTARTPSRRRGSSRGRGNSHVSSNVNLSRNQVTNQANIQKTISNTPTVVATHSNSMVSQSGSILTNAPRRTITRNRGSKKFTARPFLLQSHFAGSSLTNLNNVGNSKVVSHEQISHSSRRQSNSRNVNSRKNTVLSRNTQSDSQATLNIGNQNHHVISTSNPKVVTHASFITTIRGQAPSTFQPVKNNQRSNTVNQEKIAEFSDFEIKLTTSPMNDATTTVTEAPLLQSTISRKRSRGRAISNISRRVASNSLTSRNNARNLPIITQVTTTPSPNIQSTASLPDTTSSLPSRRTTQARTPLRPTQPSLFTSRVATGSSITSTDSSSRSRFGSQIKISNSNTQGSTPSKSSGTISVSRSASASPSTVPKLPKGHHFKLPTNFNFPGATLIAYKRTPVKKTKESSKTSTSFPSNAFKTITDVESSIGKPAVSVSSSDVETKDETLKQSKLEINTNTNNNDRNIIRKKIRINGRPGSRKSDAKDLISSSHEKSFDSTQSVRTYGPKTTAIPENIRVSSPDSTITASSITNSYGVETESVTQSSIRIAYGGNSNSDSSKRLSSVRRKTYGSDNSAGNESEGNNSRILTSVRRKNYGSDSSDTSKILTSTSRRTYGSDTSSESSALNNDNSRILTSTRRKNYGSDTSSESPTHNKQASSTSSSSFSNRRYGSGSTSGHRKTYGSDSSDTSKTLPSTSRRTFGSDTSSESSAKIDGNSRILTSARRRNYGSDTSSKSSTHNKQASSTSSSSFSTQSYGSESTSSFSQNTYGSDTSSESSFSSQKTYGSSSSSNSSVSQGSSLSSRRTYGNDVQTESSPVSYFSSQGTQESESTSQSKVIGNNHFRNVQPQIAIVTEIIPTTPASSRQGSRRRVNSRRRLVNKTKVEPKLIDQNVVNSKSTSTSTTRGNTNTSRRKVLKKVTKLSKADVTNEQSVPNVSENFTPPAPAPVLSTTTASSTDIVSSSSMSIPGLPPGLKLRVVGTSIKSSTSTRTNSSKTKNSKNNFGNTSIGRKETKLSGNSLTDLEIEALSALAKVNTGFSHSVRGRSLRRISQRQNSKVPSSS